MTVDLEVEVDEEEYLFADRCVAARSWGSPVVRGWWHVFAAPRTSSVPDALVAELPHRGPEPGGASGAERVHRFIARLLAVAVDEDGEGTVRAIGDGAWVVLQGDDAVAFLREDGGDEHRDERWMSKVDCGAGLLDVRGGAL